MWEAIGQAIQVFVEKHLIPTVISIVISIASFLVLPANYWMIVRIGKVPFALLVAGISFLILQFMLFCFRKIRTWHSNKASDSYDNQSNARLVKEKLEELWSTVDAFGPDDRKTLKEFLASGNVPIEKSSGTRYFGNSLFNSSWVISTEEYGEDKPVVQISEHLKGKAIPVNPNIFEGRRTIVVKYKLRDDIYGALKYSMDNYGKISHFE